jgi:hypothetical protein
MHHFDKFFAHFRKYSPHRTSQIDHAQTKIVTSVQALPHAQTNTLPTLFSPPHPNLLPPVGKVSKTMPI